MRVIQPSSEDEMVAVFLGAELASPRFGPTIKEQLARDGRSPRVVTEPDLADAPGSSPSPRRLPRAPAFP